MKIDAKPSAIGYPIELRYIPKIAPIDEVMSLISSANADSSVALLSPL